MLTTADLLLLDLLLLIVACGGCFGVMKFFYWLRGMNYKREAIVGDLSIVAANVIAASVFVTILPAVETLCLTSGEKTVIGVFRFIPGLFLALGIWGILFQRGLHQTKFFLAVLIVAGLALGVGHVVDDLEPCLKQGPLETIESFSISWLEVGGGFVTAITVAASALYLFERIARMRRRAKRAEDNDHSGEEGQ